ncbi:MAG: glycine zipper 2TM domain-containing protein [Gammaproteobacteria bacterium]|nr:glycine zipper 2TM domain-containing protein [Pseudomonadota bacterium]MCZ6732667.1 glycine zipper 2TM domain-containing protein [Gammaproteobacteria bacterium]
MRYITILPIVVTLLVSGCVSSKSGSVYKRDQARTVQRVELGIVEHVREVRIEGTQSGIGAAIGSVVGGIVGSEVGHGSGREIATILGAAGGGAAGATVEEATTRQEGLEITVELDNGRLIAVTQAADEPFNVGDRVRVLSGQGITRVTH